MIEVCMGKGQSKWFIYVYTNFLIIYNFIAPDASKYINTVDPLPQIAKFFYIMKVSEQWKQSWDFQCQVM